MKSIRGILILVVVAVGLMYLIDWVAVNHTPHPTKPILFIPK